MKLLNILVKAELAVICGMIAGFMLKDFFEDLGADKKTYDDDDEEIYEW